MGRFVPRVAVLAVGFEGMTTSHPHLAPPVDQPVVQFPGIVSAISDQALRRRHPPQNLAEVDEVVRLPRRGEEGQRPAGRIR